MSLLLLEGARSSLRSSPHQPASAFLRAAVLGSAGFVNAGTLI